MRVPFSGKGNEDRILNLFEVEVKKNLRFATDRESIMIQRKYNVSISFGISS